MRPTIAGTLLLLTLVATQACRVGAPTQETLQTEVAAALDTLVAELVAERPADAAAYAGRLPEYDIEAQEWITMPLAAIASIWTPPYFDAGGGEIWMITRSVPARDAGGIFAIVTTDLPVGAPGR